MRDAEQLLREVQDLLKRPTEPDSPPPGQPPPAEHPEETRDVPPPPAEEPEETRHAPPRERGVVLPRRALRHQPPPPRRSWPRVVGVLVLVAGLAAGATVAVLRLRSGGGAPGDDPAGAPSPPQEVVAWTVWNEKPALSFVTVLADAEGREPVLLGIPPYTVVPVPGRGLGTVEDASRAGDGELVAITVSSLLHVEVDRSVSMKLSEVAAMVDRAGGLGVDGSRRSGEAVMDFLTERGVDRELRFLRWQGVISALLPVIGERPELGGGLLTGPVLEVFRAVGAARPDPLELPVEDVGSGLARPVKAEVEALAREWFVPTARTDGPVRLVVLNGNGVPGVGERVARVLVPAGFRLVSSQNATSFKERVTLIVAADERFVDEARLARELLGVGRVVIDPQPTSVADVTVVVGRDFRRR